MEPSCAFSCDDFFVAKQDRLVDVYESGVRWLAEIGANYAGPRANANWRRADMNPSRADSPTHPQRGEVVFLRYILLVLWRVLNNCIELVIGY